MDLFIKNPKILIIQTAFIGDVILTTPLIEVLKKKYPDAIIDFITIPKSKNLLETNPHIRNLIIYDKREKDRGIRGIFKFSKFISSEKYTICITPHRSLRSAILTRSSGATLRIGFDLTAWKGAFTHLVFYKTDIHEIERNLSLLNTLGIKSDRIPPVLYADNEDVVHVNKVLNDAGIKNNSTPLALAPGSIWPTKRWPEEYFEKLCQIIAQKAGNIVLIGGEDDRPLCERISHTSEAATSVAGKLSLRQTYHLLKSCSALLTNDSAPLHLGQAAGISVYAIFGPTVPSFGFAPFGEHSYVIEQKELNCRPCGIHGGKKCPTKTFDCMLRLKPEMVAEQIATEYK